MILITGGAGFIGSHIVDCLIENNMEIVIVDNLSSGNIKNINNKSIFYKVDIKNYSELENIFMNYSIDIVIHLAAQVSVAYSISHPIEDCNENILGSLNVIELSKKYGVKKIIVSSSAAVYGEPKYLPIDEKHELNELSYYALSKITMERYIKLSGLDYIILRFANVYGPRQTVHGEAGVVSIFVNKILSNEIINIFGDGMQTRDFIFVEDIAKIVCMCVEKEIVNETINISTSTKTSVNELYKKLIYLSKKECEVKYLDERVGDIKHSVLSNNKLVELVGFNFTEIDSGLDKTIRYFINN